MTNYYAAIYDDEFFDYEEKDKNKVIKLMDAWWENRCLENRESDGTLSIDQCEIIEYWHEDEVPDAAINSRIECPAAPEWLVITSKETYTLVYEHMDKESDIAREAYFMDKL